MEPEQFGYHFVTRTTAIGHRGLRRRDPERVASVERSFAEQTATQVSEAGPANEGGVHALTRAVDLGRVRLPNRLVVDVGPTRDGARSPRINALHIIAAQRGGAGLVLADLREPGTVCQLPGLAVVTPDPAGVWAACLRLARTPGARPTAPGWWGPGCVSTTG
jgi:hypothetical protein